MCEEETNIPSHLFIFICQDAPSSIYPSSDWCYLPIYQSIFMYLFYSIKGHSLRTNPQSPIPKFSYLSIYLSIYLSRYLSIYLYIYLSIYLLTRSSLNWQLLYIYIFIDISIIKQLKSYHLLSYDSFQAGTFIRLTF